MVQKIIGYFNVIWDEALTSCSGSRASRTRRGRSTPPFARRHGARQCSCARRRGVTTQKEMATAIGVSAAYLSALEHGRPAE